MIILLVTFGIYLKGLKKEIESLNFKSLPEKKKISLPFESKQVWFKRQTILLRITILQNKNKEKE